MKTAHTDTHSVKKSKQCSHPLQKVQLGVVPASCTSSCSTSCVSSVCMSNDLSDMFLTHLTAMCWGAYYSSSQEPMLHFWEICSWLLNTAIIKTAFYDLLMKSIILTANSPHSRLPKYFPTPRHFCCSQGCLPLRDVWCALSLLCCGCGGTVFPVFAGECCLHSAPWGCTVASDQRRWEC